MTVDVITPELSVIGYSLGIMGQSAYLVITKLW